MQNAIEIVRDFFDAWSKGTDAMRASLYTYLAPDVVWENVGLGQTVGVEEAATAFFSFEPMKTADRMDVEMLNISATGNVVFTERLDRVIDAAGKTIILVQVAGVMEIENGKIKAWRDYFDTQPFAQAAGPA